jgi:putative ATPase
VPRFYQPVARGLEIRIGERIAELRRLDDAALREAERGRGAKD